MSAAVNGHRRRSSVPAAPVMNGSLAGMKDVSPEEMALLAHGVQVIDENKEFTSVPHGSRLCFFYFFPFSISFCLLRFWVFFAG